MKKFLTLSIFATLLSLASFAQSFIGPDHVCVGGVVTLSHTSGTGIWSSSNPSVATIGSSSGIVTGISPGVVTIYYFRIGTLDSMGFTVHPNPTPITGPGVVATGGTITLSSTPPGGTWSSGCPTILTINPTSGVVTGVGPGSCNVYYTTPGGCSTHRNITDSGSTTTPVDSILGPSSGCVGSITTLFNGTPGGTWSSSNPAVATISSSGVVTAISVGTTIITYNVSGSFATHMFTVVPGSSISGPSTLCVGSSIVLTGTPTGGTWTSSATAIAAVTGGLVSGMSAGVATITYSAGGCISTRTVTVSVGPSPISGSTTVGVGGTTTLTDATPGGVWSSSNSSIALIGSSTGIVTGVSTGTCTITYTVGSGCFVTITFTVGTTSGIGPITGASGTCVGSSTPLSSTTPGGTWSSSNPAIATVTSTGMVTGVSAGTVTITYTVGSSFVTRLFTVIAAAGISGPASVCVGSTITMVATPGGGTWSVGSTTVATISSSGVVTGVAAGVTTIFYTVGGCYAYRVVTVNPIPAVITGTTTTTVGGTSTLTDATTGGTWSSSNPAIATIGSSTGIVTGVAAGTCTITYSVGGCFRTTTFTVTMVTIGPITGPTGVCVGSVVTLTSTTPGGTWSSSNTTIAAISSAGVVTGVSAGTATITYTVGSSFVTRAIAVLTTPSTITGIPFASVGGTATLGNSVPGGSWSSSNTGIATVSSAGVVTGVSAGTCTITYSIGSCFRTIAFTVTGGTTIAPIVGPTGVCVGSVITLTDSTPGGTWSSSNTAIATISSTGVVTGVSAGTVTITYTVGSTFVTRALAVLPTPAAITGTTTTTVGGTSVLSNSVGGGAWSSSNTGIATVNTAGVVTGVSAGTCTITYSIGSCFRTVTFTVTGSTTIGPITGPTGVCVGSVITLTSTTPGGTWSSSNPSIASIVPTTGVVTGVSAGSVTITYTVGSSFVTRALAVLITPAAITGTTTTTVGSTSTLSNSVTGGTWSSSNTGIATVNTAGVVTGVSAGTCTITYSIGSCFRTVTFTVTGTSIAPITGPSTVCVGSTIVLSDSTPGGTWSSGNPSRATISSTGVVTGISAGTVTITYTVGSSFVTRTITVSAGATISGPGTVCVGSSITLSGTPTGGFWTSGSTAIAAVGSTGVVTGMGVGVTNITYSSGGCTAIKSITVNMTPVISGSTTLCIGTTATFVATPSGGTWSSSNTAIATVSTSGVVVGVATGVVTISYTAGGCTATRTVTINTAASISGSSTLCIGSTTTLVATPSGGTWSSSAPGVASVSTTGVVTGVASGVATIYYTMGGCSAYKVVTVNTTAVISGSGTACVGSTTTLSGSPTGGTWTSGSTAIAAVSSTGVVTGMSVGVANITYTTGGCAAVKAITVNVTPTITGITSLCLGTTGVLIATPTGGTWSSGNTAIATVSSTGVVTGVSAGTVNIYYTVGGCSTFRTITVTTGATISGSGAICIGSALTLTASIGGGTWTSGNTAIATVNTAGVVTGVSAGTVSISYNSGGCIAVTTVTVNASATVAGSSTVCIGSTIILTAAPTGGTWTSSNTTRATVSSTGVVSGLSAGVVTIYYSAGGCAGYKVVTVNAAPTITGASSVCVGATTILTASPAGGTWSSSNTAIATVSTTGMVTGVSAGVVSITYSVGGCTAVTTITVNPTATISGGSSVCVGSSITLSGSPSGGTWASGYTAIATVGSSTGVVTGVSTGTITIYYSLGGCYAYRTITVATSPSAIAGASVVCAGSSISLSCSTPGGSWSSANPAIASVSSTGAVTGISAGVTTISYTVGACSVTKLVTVNPSPSPITGPTTVAVGSTVTLSSATPGGTWLSSNPSKATINPMTGVATGVSSGSVTIYYTVGGCSVTRTLIVTGSARPGGNGSFTTGSDESSMSIFPNPTPGAMNVQWQNCTTGNADLVVSDMTGRVVFTTQFAIDNESGQAQVELSSLKDGIYLVTIRSEAVFFSNKLIIAH